MISLSKSLAMSMEDQRLDVHRKFSYNCGEIIHERIAKLLKLINKSFPVFAANAVTFGLRDVHFSL